MQSKTLALFALSASAAIASPFNKRAELQHHRFHQARSGFLPTGTGQAFPAGNDTNGVFAPTGSGALTMTLSSVPADFGNVATDAASSSCTDSDIATVTSTNLVTVTARDANRGYNRAYDPGNSRGGGNRGQNNGWGQSSAATTTQGYSVPKLCCFHYP